MLKLHRPNDWSQNLSFVMMISIVTCNISCSCLFVWEIMINLHRPNDWRQNLPWYQLWHACNISCSYLFFVGDGAWTTWGEWGDCSRSCAGGYRRRGRTCTNPTPNYFSTKEACEDNIPYDMERCNTQACTREFVKILIIWRGVILKPAHVSLFRF